MLIEILSLIRYSQTFSDTLWHSYTQLLVFQSVTDANIFSDASKTRKRLFKLRTEINAYSIKNCAKILRAEINTGSEITCDGLIMIARKNNEKFNKEKSERFVLNTLLDSSGGYTYQALFSAQINGWQTPQFPVKLKFIYSRYHLNFMHLDDHNTF